MINHTSSMSDSKPDDGRDWAREAEAREIDERFNDVNISSAFQKASEDMKGISRAADNGELYYVPLDNMDRFGLIDNIRMAYDSDTPLSSIWNGVKEWNRNLSYVHDSVDITAESIMTHKDFQSFRARLNTEGYELSNLEVGQINQMRAPNIPAARFAVRPLDGPGM
ncbi:MAG: hypothetical protein QF692_05345 [Alphaproteobacteria bacterium]|jgi:hypothetical protein|nr:hypothetical protein [Alphaproteobacteria bacterium]MDP7222670.1 hypothetical protein [Alphaproteobacteria bacterium]